MSRLGTRADPELLEPRGVLNLQRQAGNAAVARLVRERDQEFKAKIDAIKGGLEGLKLNVTWNVSGKKATTLQAVQAWWGSGSKLGKEGRQDPDRDRQEGVRGLHRRRPVLALRDAERQQAGAPHPAVLPGADEHKTHVTWDADKGSIRIYDLPSASAFFEEMFFETAIVAVDVDGKGTDEILKVLRRAARPLSGGARGRGRVADRRRLRRARPAVEHDPVAAAVGERGPDRRLRGALLPGRGGGGDERPRHDTDQGHGAVLARARPLPRRRAAREQHVRSRSRLGLRRTLDRPASGGALSGSALA